MIHLYVLKIVEDNLDWHYVCGRANPAAVEKDASLKSFDWCQ